MTPTDFRTWSHESLARFAAEQKDLNDKLRAALAAAEQDRRDVLIEMRKMLGEKR